MSVYSRIYDASYSPAAPVVDIIVKAAEEPIVTVEIEALVDSGADATLLPLAILEEVGASYYETRRMRGITSSASSVDLYLVTLQIGPVTIRGVRAVALLQSREALLGRDVLNQIRLTLDGPAEVLEID